MIDPIECSLDCFDRRQAGELGAFDHNHPDVELPRRFDLRIGRVAAAVLGNDHLDTMPEQHLQFVRQPERPPAMDIADVRRRQRRVDRIDAADPVVMMGRGVSTMRLLPAGRHEHSQGRNAECGYGLRDAMHRKPVIAGNRHPGRPPQGKGQNAALSHSLRCIDRDAGCERMGCVDHQIDGFLSEIAGQTFGATKAAAAHRDQLRGRIGGSAGQRQHDIEIGASGEYRREFTSLRRAAQDQNAGLTHG